MKDSLSTKDRAQIADYVALYRSVGLLSGKVDLFGSMKTLADTGTLAFYDPTDKHVYIRGTKMTVDLRITLVHELTHVLQDQHFDLLKIEKAADKANGDSMAVHALVEGDAEDIESQAVDQLSAADKKAYDATQLKLSSNDDAKKLQALPKVFVDSFSAPYDFGEQFVKILKDQGGESAIDAAFRKPPTSFAEIWNPFVYLEGQKPLAVTAPKLPKGAKKVDASQVGSFDTFLVFAERLPALQSLDAADAWRGDRSLTYKKDGTVCTDIRMRAGDTAGAATLRKAWRDWVAAMPGGLASVRDTAGNGVSIHTCDPGPEVDLHVSDKGDQALVYPVDRLQVATSVLDEAKKGTAIQMTPAAAYCFADAILRIVPVDALSGADPNWQPDWDYNRNDPANLFRPWSYQVGHLTEWAKLLLILNRVRPDAWLVPRAVELFGAESMSEWRFSTDGRPPAASPERIRALPWRPDADVVEHLPFGEGESLRQVEDRLRPLWEDELRPALAAGRTVLVVAHTDSLRALRRVVEGRDQDEGDTLRVVPAQPLAYRTDGAGNVIPPALYLENQAAV